MFNKSGVGLRSTRSMWDSPLDPRIYVILASASLILLFYSIWEIKPVTVEINDFLGLASHLTPAYWAGYILIVFCSLRLYLDTGVKNGLVYILVLFVVGLFFFGVPVFAQENARFPWSYYPAGEVRTILETKYIDSISEYPLLSYRTWPATHLLSASIIYLAGIQLESLLKYMPLFWMLSVILIVFFTAKRLGLSSSQSFLVSLLVISSLWIYNYYYGPQSIAYILYLLLFMLIVGFGSTDKFRDTVLISLTFTAMVITHLLTSIAVLASFLASSQYVLPMHGKRIKFTVFFIVILVAWYIYLAPYVVKSSVQELIVQLGQPALLSFAQTNKYSAGDLLTRQITHYSRLAYVGIYALFTVASAALYLSGRVKEENRGMVKACFAWLLGTLALIVFRYGEAEIDDRVYMFSLVPMALVIVSSFDRKLLAVLALLLIVPHIPAHYGSESFDMVRTTELRGAEFFAENIPIDKNPYEPYSYYYTTYIRFYDPEKILMEDYSFTGARRPNVSVVGGANYIANSRGSYNFMMYAHGFDPIQVWIDSNQNNINSFYDNGYFKIYKKCCDKI